MSPTDNQRENVFQNFKFNRRTARLSLIWGALVPFGTFLLMSNYDVSLAGSPVCLSGAEPCSPQRKYDFLGVRRDTSLLRSPPPAPATGAADEE